MPGSSPDDVQTTRYLKSWMIGGGGVIIVAGALLHYVFESTGESRFIGTFVPQLLFSQNAQLSFFLNSSFFLFTIAKSH